MSKHEHHYVFLRQEIRPTRHGWNNHVLERLTEDIFVCESCLDYRWVPVRREQPRSDRSGWYEVAL